MTTYRERREARAARLEEWAEKRRQKADAAYEHASARADLIPFGQPVLTDHYSYRGDVRYRERIAKGFERSFEDARKAEEMASKAANIRAAADRAIYSDDDDAIERLREKLAGLEAQRAETKAFNASYRKAKTDEERAQVVAEAPEYLRDSFLRTLSVAAWQCEKGFPSYKLSNLGGTINATKKRIASLGGQL